MKTSFFVIALLLFFHPATQISAQPFGCGNLVISLQPIPPSNCCYRLVLNNAADVCYQQLNLSLDQGNFSGTTVAAGWQTNVVSPSEFNLLPIVGFIPFGQSQPITFCVGGGASPTLTLLWNDLCAMEGCATTFSVNSCMTPLPCAPNFSFVVNCCVVSYSSLSTPTSGLTYLWDFGDGQTSSLQNPVHTYLDCCKTYTVCLSISSPSCPLQQICQQVTVSDTQKPVITCPPNQVFFNCNSNFGIATATDNCDPSPIVVRVGPDIITGLYPCDATITRNWLASDMCNNTSACQQVITLIDNQAPVFNNCPQSQLTVLGTTDLQGICTSTAVVLPQLTASDNCAVPVIVTNNAPAVFSGGITTVTYSASDNCNNNTTCVLSVNVQCCPGCLLGVAQGPELIITNGDFSAAIVPTGFSSSYGILTSTCSPSLYNVATSVTVGAMCPPEWGGIDHTTGSSTGRFFVADGSTSPNIAAWRSLPLNLAAGQTYNLCSFANNLDIPNFNANFPNIAAYVVENNGIGTAHLITSTGLIPESPDVWVYLGGLWTAPLVINPCVLEFRSNSLAFGGNNFALDDISFRACGSAPCTTTISATNVLCDGQSTVLTATGGPWTSCQWSTSNAGTSITVTSPGLYCVTCTNAAGCTATACDTVVLKPRPVVNITGNLSVCSGQSTTLTAVGSFGSPSYTYQWNNPPGGTSNTVIVTPTIQTHVYTVVCTDMMGCTSSASVNVQIVPYPGFFLTDSTICSGQTVSLTASGGSTYFWSEAGQTTASINVNPTITTVYTVTVTVPPGCSATGTATITVLPVNLNANLTGYFPFNDVPGITLDASAIIANGTSVNVTTTNAQNLAPSAAAFNGTSSWIDCTNNTRLVTDKVSLVAWVKTNVTTRGMWVAGQYMGGNTPRGYSLSIGDVTNSNIGLPSFGGRVNAAQYYAATSTTTVNNGQWHCLVGTADASNSDWRIYVDGNLAGATPIVLGPPGGIAPNNTSFTIGRNSFPSIGTMWYQGAMDDVRVYNRILTECEIKAICATNFVSDVPELTKDDGVRVYPNPHSEAFTLELPFAATEGTMLFITDLSGQLLLKIPAESGVQTQIIHATSLSKGMYFLHVMSDGSLVALEKLVKF